MSRQEFSDPYFANSSPSENFKSRAVRGGGVTIASRVTNYALHLVGTVVLARLLSPEDFGLVSMVTSVNGFLLVLRDLGLADAVIQSRDIDQRKVSALFWVNALAGAIFCIIATLLSPLLVRLYNEPRVRSVSIVLSLTFLFYGLSDMHFALLRRSMQFGRVAVCQVIATIVGTSLAVVCALGGFGYWSLVMRSVGSTIALVVGGWICCKWRPGFQVRRSGIRSLLIFGGNSIGYLITSYFSRSLDKTLVGWRFGAAQLGYYDRAFTLFMLPVSELTISLHSVAVATLSRLRDDPVRFRRYYLEAVSTISLVAMPVSAFMAIASRDIVYFLLGPQWEQSAPLFTILALSAGTYAVYATIEWLHVSMGRAERWFKWGLLSFIVTVGGILIGLASGTKGVAAAYSIAIVVLTGPAIAYAGRPAGLRFWDVLAVSWRYFVAAAIAAGACILVGRVLHPAGALVRLFAFIGVFGAAYVALVLILHRSTAPFRRFFRVLATLFQGAAPGRKASGTNE